MSRKIAANGRSRSSFGLAEHVGCSINNMRKWRPRHISFQGDNESETRNGLALSFLTQLR
jgi:hypothetical protein